VEAGFCQTASPLLPLAGADDTLGTVSATRLKGDVLKVRVTACPRGRQQTAVRISGQ
jgi:hypothetical protein